MKGEKPISKEEMSSIGFTKYPTNRNAEPKSISLWLEGKVVDDDIRGESQNGRPLWRVRNKLYDFTDFASKHPGGEDWFHLMKNTDITEAFEAHHPNIEIVEKYLSMYYIKDTNKPRNSPFTFEKDGFYCTLRKRVQPLLPILGKGSTTKMKLIQDSLVIGWFVMALLSVIFHSYCLSIISGIFLGMSTICAHNFFHQSDNWRMYIFDLSLFSSYDWRASHAISHHLYTNTIYDFEIAVLEPFFIFLPREKNFVQKYLVYVYIHVIYFLAIPIEFGKRIVGLIRGTTKFRKEYTFPLIFLIILLLVGQNLSTLFIWTTMHFASSFWFSFVGLIAAHHHPDIWHDGDKPTYESKDWGICQIDAVRDRAVVTNNLFLVSTMFGDHTLHHLFPTIDHSKLPLLRPIFLETCKEFGVKIEEETIFSMMWGKYRQLSRTKVH